MRFFLRLAYFVWLGVSISVANAATPNIVVIISDDQGYADISFNPHHPAEVSTPHMDALARDGVFFTQAYTSGSVCSPTRAGLMLGRYQQRVGVYTAGEGGRGFDPQVPIFPTFLPDQYRSTAIGKWHLGLDEDYPELKWHALSRGFDECYKFMGRGAHDYFKLSDSKDPIYRSKEQIKDEGYLTDRLSEEAVEFIDRNKDRPFFLYLAYNAVHSPAQAPKEDIEFFKAKYPELSEDRVILMAMLKHLDDGIGDVVKKLKTEALFENTLLFFLTDNGGAKGMNANNAPLKGYKHSYYEGGIRTPFIVSWPAKFEGGRTIDSPIVSLDILPTALDAVGVEQGKGSFDGKSLLPLLVGQTEPHHDTLFWSNGSEGEWAVRRGDWKLHSMKGSLELIHLSEDPAESSNLASSHPQKVQELKIAYDKWLSQMAEPIKGGKEPKDKADADKVTVITANITEKEIKRAQIREERRAQKLAEKAKQKAKEKTGRKPSDDNATDNKPGVDSSLPSPHTPISKAALHAFDLSLWKLTLPTNDSNQLNGHAAEISPAQLAAGFECPYFQTMDNELVFWCPVSGATTGGTEYPRSELRELLDAGDPAVNWSAHGSHVLEARCRVVQVPSNPKVVIGQIHSFTGKSKPLVKLQYYKDRVEALVKVSPNSGADHKLTFSNVAIGSDIDYRIQLTDGLLSITVNNETQTYDVFNSDHDWSRQSFYFKAGVYPQDNEGDESEGARVSFSKLLVSHKQL